jgi:enoyl-CoA hydratase/carnithine racemase
MDKSAPLSLPFINLGLVPEAASSLLLPQLAGQRNAAELLLLGENFDANKALEMGIANQLTTSASLQKTAMATAKKLAAKPSGVLRQTKALMKADFESVSKRMDREGRVFEKCLQSDYTKQALKSFLGKSGPN